MSRSRSSTLPFVALSVLAFGPAALQAQPTTHTLPLAPENIHWGYYDASVEPAVRIRSGDGVYFENLLARGLERLRQAGFDEARFSPAMVAVEEAETVRLGAHPLNGPILVEGAEAGDVLEVRILDIGFLAPYGVSGHLPGGGIEDVLAASVVSYFPPANKVADGFLGCTACRCLGVHRVFIDCVSGLLCR